MSRTPAERLASMTRESTLYELALTSPDRTRKILVAYCNRTGRRGLYNAVAKDGRREAIVALTGTEEITFAKRSADGAKMNGWEIKFSGRTQREAIAQGELPYCETVANS